VRGRKNIQQEKRGLYAMALTFVKMFVFQTIEEGTKEGAGKDGRNRT